ncbi:MAG: hypothetical protein B7Y45_00965 [Sphingomonas sp. 28-66-16]|nr:MAG: hypothetical protein B7Y45_00965 [Sphingomonas sp. 28-66-16]
MSKTRFIAPAQACDCHAHVFDRADPPSAETAAAYAVPDAPYAAYRAMLDSIGLTRGVLVQPSAYADDHRVLLAALRHAEGRLAGIGLLDAGAHEGDFDVLAAGGVVGLRFVEARVPDSGARFANSIGIDALPDLCGAMAARGWHAEIWAPLAQAAAICDDHAGRGVPIVLDHLAGAAAQTDPADPAFRAIVEHVRRGHVWVKLVLCRTAATPDGYAAARPLHEALVAANPGRLLWGTDWPFLRKGQAAPAPSRLLDSLADWTPDPRHLHAILVTNPAAFYFRKDRS